MPYDRNVPMLTNIPETAETAQRAGSEVYFLSDRPETEEFLAQRFDQRPYKQVLRDIRSSKPAEDQLLLSEARRDFGANEGQKMLGFNPNSPPNPGEIAQAARDKYFNLATPEQIQGWDEKTRKLHYSEAEKRGKAAYQEVIGKVNAAKNMMSMFDKSWTERQKQIKEQEKQLRAAQEPSKEPMLPVIEGGKRVWRPRSQVSGREIPEGMKETIDAEGNIIYTPSTQAVGKTAPPKGGGKTEEDKEKADRQKAITMAQREPDWRLGNEKTNSWLVEKNLAVLQDREPPEPPEEVLESREIRKGTKIDLKNKEHMAVLKRLRREADAKATKEGKIDTDKARKILNQKIEEKGWILPMGINLKVK